MTASDPLDHLNSLLSAMPPVAAMGMRACHYDAFGLRLSAPLDANVNDKGCAFGGSLASAMTLAAWGWLMLELRANACSAEVYVADSQIRYLAPLYGDLLAEAQPAPDQDWPAALRALGERRRARAQMLSQVLGPDGKAIASLSARFALIASPAIGPPVA